MLLYLIKMENKFDIDLCVMDSIIMVRALNRERLALMELMKLQQDDENKYINEKRVVRVCCLLDKVQKAMKNISPEEIEDNYWDDKLSM